MDTVVQARPAAAESQLAENSALGFAILTLLGSLYLSMGMGLNACPLCFYQRAFIMSVIAVIGGGTFLRLPVLPGMLSLMALPLALGGLGVALVHTNLVRTEVLACPNGIFGLGAAPYQSLAAFIVVTALLIPGAVKSGISPIQSGPRSVAMLGIGVAFTALSLLSSPSVPPYKPTFNEAGVRVLKSCERAKPESIAATTRP